MRFSHEHVCVFVFKLSTATTHTSKHDTLQWDLQSSFLPGAGMREQLLMLVFGAGRTPGKCLGSLSAGGERRCQTDKLLDHRRLHCLRLDTLSELLRSWPAEALVLWPSCWESTAQGPAEHEGHRPRKHSRSVS